MPTSVTRIDEGTAGPAAEAPFVSKKQLAKERLLRAIRTGRYRPGDWLRQDRIARDLGLSSTPVREALSELQTSGVVAYEAHKGVRVAALDAVQITQVYAARKAIERETARLAFPRLAAHVGRLRAVVAEMARLIARDHGDHREALMAADEAFHLAIFEAAGNDYLLASIRALWDAFPRYLIWSLEGRLAHSVAEHAGMVAAIEAGDEAGFLVRVEAHLDNACRGILDHLAGEHA